MTDKLDPMAWYDHAQHPVLRRGEVLFSKIWGSHSHNTATPESDVDYLAVYRARNADLLGMAQAPDTLTGEKPDYQVHEVGKFCCLLMKGNPGIVEMLFTDRLEVAHPLWKRLLGFRESYLTRTAVQQYLGYCQGQLKKLAHHGGEAGLHTKGGEYNTKWAYHMIRLAFDARRIASGKAPVVWKDSDTEEWAILMSIRGGEWSKDRVERAVVSLIGEIDGMKPWKIPDEGDSVALNDWLLRVRGDEPQWGGLAL